MRATHLDLWKASRCTRTSWTLLLVKDRPANGSNDTAPSMIFCGELWNGRRFRQQRNWLIRFCKMGNSQTAAHWFHRPEASQGTRMSLSHRGRCSDEPGSGQQNRQVRWTGQHAHLSSSCHRNRRYLESLGCWTCLEIGRRTTLITGEPRESTFLFQQLSIALKRGNAVAFLNTFDSDKCKKSV